MVGGHTLDFCVLHAPSAHTPQRAEELWDKAGSVLRTVFRPTRDIVVMIDANGRLVEAGTSWRPHPFEPLPLSTWTSRAGKEHEIDFVLVPSAWHHLVQWNAVIPRVSLALPGQEDHRLVATHIALQPKSTVAVAPFTFYSRDALGNPQTALFDYRVAFAMWNERYFGASARRACRTDYQAWLLAQTEKISSAAESGDERPFWSLVRALKGKRKRLVSRPVVDSAGVPATEPSRVAELMEELFCTEFGHSVKIDSLDDHSLSSSCRARPCPFEVPSVADVQAPLESPSPDCSR